VAYKKGETYLPRSQIVYVMFGICWWVPVKQYLKWQTSLTLTKKETDVMLLYNRDRNWYQPYCCGSSGWCCRLMFQRYEVCSNSIRIGNVVVVHWVGCVCNQSWHVRTCLSNSWHKLQVAAFARLAVVGRGSNTCVYVMAIFTMYESTEQRICIKFCFKIGKTATETYQLLQQA